MGKNIRIVPAILTNDAKELEKLVRQSELFTDFVQLDIMDGNFVPSKSVSHEQITKIKPRIKWEAHLMVLNPENCLKDFQQAGAQKIVFHYEATPSPEKVIKAIGELGIQAGLAVNPETPNSVIIHFIKQIDSILFLSVNPGFYGAKFIPEVLDKIVDLRKRYPKLEIGIDGGIKESNVTQIARTGVDVICVGSAIFLQPDPAASYKRLKAQAKSAAE